MIAAVNICYHKRTHKFRFLVPKTLQKALNIDKENSCHNWEIAIQNEMHKVQTLFDNNPKDVASCSFLAAY